MRSLMAPKARVPPVPIAATPEISRQAIPAIFETTFWATLILPSSVFSRLFVATLLSLLLDWLLVETIELGVDIALPVDRRERRTRSAHPRCNSRGY